MSRYLKVNPARHSRPHRSRKWFPSRVPQDDASQIRRNIEPPSRKRHRSPSEHARTSHGGSRPRLAPETSSNAREMPPVPPLPPEDISAGIGPPFENWFSHLDNFGEEDVQSGPVPGGSKGLLWSDLHSRHPFRRIELHGIDAVSISPSGKTSSARFTAIFDPSASSSVMKHSLTRRWDEDGASDNDANGEDEVKFPYMPLLPRDCNGTIRTFLPAEHRVIGIVKTLHVSYDHHFSEVPIDIYAADLAGCPADVVIGKPAILRLCKD